MGVQIGLEVVEILGKSVREYEHPQGFEPTYQCWDGVVTKWNPLNESQFTSQTCLSNQLASGAWDTPEAMMVDNPDLQYATSLAHYTYDLLGNPKYRMVWAYQVEAQATGELTKTLTLLVPAPSIYPSPATEVGPRPADRPEPRTLTALIPVYPARPRVRLKYPSRPTRPPRRVKERKFEGVRRAVGLVDPIYEGIEFLDGLHDALPPDCQAPKNAPPHEKAAALWNCYDKIRVPVAIWNTIQNMIEDAVIGRAIGAAEGATDINGRPSLGARRGLTGGIGIL